MNILKTALEGVVIIKPQIFGDTRGYFFESFNEREFCKEVLHRSYRPGGEALFVQDNESKSSYGVVRGLHYQKPPYAQSKLIRVIKGMVLDVAVDIRKNSPTFGKHVAVELSGDNHSQLFIPRGFAHGFSVLSPEAILQYKCDNLYAPGHEGAILWNDPALEIEWKVPSNLVTLSEKDKSHPLLSEIELVFDYNTDCNTNKTVL